LLKPPNYYSPPTNPNNKGALVLLVMDNRIVQSMEWFFMLWPSLALTLAVALPVGALTNLLKRRFVFDWPQWRHRAATVNEEEWAWEGREADRWREALWTAPGQAPPKNQPPKFGRYSS